MTNHGALSEKSRLAALATIVGILIGVAVVAIVVVTTGSDPSGAGTPAQADRKTGPSVSASTATSAPTSPSGSASSTPSAAKTSAEPSTSPVAEKSSLPKKARKSITYTVKRGDNLTVIAAWFKLHGYGKLYEKNKSVIGADPDLIRPGQKITVSGHGMTVSSDK